MPSKAPPPVLQDWAGWSPYQQQTSVALVIESPTPAMLLGRGGAGASEAAIRLSTRTLRIRIANPFCLRARAGFPVVVAFTPVRDVSRSSSTPAGSPRYVKRVDPRGVCLRGRERGGILIEQ